MVSPVERKTNKMVSSAVSHRGRHLEVYGFDMEVSPKRLVGWRRAPAFGAAETERCGCWLQKGISVQVSSRLNGLLRGRAYLNNRKTVTGCVCVLCVCASGVYLFLNLPLPLFMRWGDQLCHSLLPRRSDQEWGTQHPETEHSEVMN